MTRRETITSAAVTINDVYHLRNWIIQIGWTQSFCYGTDKRGAYLISQNNSECDGYGTTQSYLPAQVAYNDVKQRRIKWYPHYLAAKGIHKRVRPRGMPSVDGEKAGIVRLNQL